MYRDIVGVILAGGKSTRMGQDKSFLQIGNQTAIERTVSLMKSLFENVVLIVNEPKKYECLGLPMFSDIHSNQGPLAGIHSALVNSSKDKLFVISCDMPLVSADVVNFIAKYPSDSQIIVPIAGGFVQQLCGIYTKSCIPIIEKILSENLESEVRHSCQEHRKCKILRLLNEANAEKIDLENCFAKYEIDVFLNMNRPEDYQKICELIKTQSTHN